MMVPQQPRRQSMASRNVAFRFDQIKWLMDEARRNRANISECIRRAVDIAMETEDENPTSLVRWNSLGDRRSEDPRSCGSIPSIGRQGDGPGQGEWNRLDSTLAEDDRIGGSSTSGNDAS